MKISYEEWKKNMEEGIVDIIDDRLYGKYMKKYENDKKEEHDEEEEDEEELQKELEIQEDNYNYSIIVLILSISIITIFNLDKIQDIIINNIGI